MKLKFGFYLFLALASCAALAASLFSASDRLHYKSIKPGLEYAQVHISGSTVRLHALRLDLKKFQLRPILAADYGSKSLSVKKMAQTSLALAVLNASFFDPEKKPLGLIIDRKKPKNPGHPTSWWSHFVVYKQRAQILRSPSKILLQNAECAVQTGPRLVINGSVPQLKKNFSRKSAIGIDAHGHVVLVMSEGSMESQAFAEILAQPLSKNGLGLHYALNLDGGSSSQFYVNAGYTQVDLGSFVDVPVGLGVFDRSTSPSE